MDHLPVKNELFAFGCFAALMVVALVVLWPICAIWSLNTLFGLGIPYTVNTWLAVLLLVSILRFQFPSPEKR